MKRSGPDAAFRTLAAYLEAQGVEKEDIQILEVAMKEDPKPTDKKFGKKVAACMISKAATEAWKVGTDVAAKVLTKAVEQHYGLPPGLSALISLAPALTNTQHLSPFNWPTA